jgi:hypothetical protein
VQARRFAPRNDIIITLAKFGMILFQEETAPLSFCSAHFPHFLYGDLICQLSWMMDIHQLKLYIFEGGRAELNMEADLS